jgi:CheY-like chemotaxis protein
MLILAVDDDYDDLELFRDAVKEIDSCINLICANTGEEALNFLKKKAIAYPDYIFLDINMPKLDGRQCLQAIRQDKNTKHLPVIMYSTSLSTADKELFKDLNAQFISKSSSYNELLASLTSIISQLKARDSQPVSLINPESN